MIDEYENLLDYQQQVANTLVKHAGDTYSFKIGVRELGWRCRSTLNVNEQLIHPADYARINIAEKLQGETFDSFAMNVCSARIARLHVPSQTILRDLRLALPSLSEEDEAIQLGVEALAATTRTKLLATGSTSARELVERMHPLEVYFLQFWADTKHIDVNDVLREAATDTASWNVRYGNYKYALLFTIRRKKRGIRKHYCGWSTFTQLAAGNIRYVLELVDQSFLAQFREVGTLEHPISPEVQTKAAQQVGGMKVSELEGLAVDGAHLTKLLLSLGRVFQVMAADAVGHAPEINQFEVALAPDRPTDQSLLLAVDRLLGSAVMHLALLRFPGNKPGDVGDTKDYDYMIHPVFSPFFIYSFRRKRRMSLRPETLLALIKSPKQAIRAILADHNRNPEQQDLPEQLSLFERFYDGGA